MFRESYFQSYRISTLNGFKSVMVPESIEVIWKIIPFYFVFILRPQMWVEDFTDYFSGE